LKWVSVVESGMNPVIRKRSYKLGNKVFVNSIGRKEGI